MLDNANIIDEEEDDRCGGNTGSNFVAEGKEKKRSCLRCGCEVVPGYSHCEFHVIVDLPEDFRVMAYA